MTTEELHKILDDENKTISLEEYQEVLYQLKNDTIYFATQVETKQHYYNGETNAFQIALDLSEHINPNQKAIECLKEVKEELLDISNGYWKCFAKYGQQYMTSDDLDECLKEYIDTKIKELE